MRACNWRASSTGAATFTWMWPARRLEPAERQLAPAEADATAQSQRLVSRIAEEIDAAGGWIPFDRFMQRALYEPGLGYYAAKPSKIGPLGDFVTAPEISPLFARALAAQVAQAFEHLPRRLLEFGAGSGLCEAVAHIEAAVGPLPDGYASEVGLVAQAWTATLGQWLRRGVALLVDYGFPRHEYYHPQRAMGTLMCHFRHRAHDDPLWLPGLNDITAHVDFTAIAQAARSAALEVLGYTSQARFLLDCGLLELMREAPGSAAANTAALRLLSEAEMGEL